MLTPAGAVRIPCRSAEGSEFSDPDIAGVKVCTHPHQVVASPCRMSCFPSESPELLSETGARRQPSGSAEGPSKG